MKGIARNIYMGLNAEAALEVLPQQPLASATAILFPGNKALLKRLYKTLSDLSGSTSCPFFFVLPGSGVGPGNISEVGRFFFLSNYYHAEGCAPRLVFKEKAPAEEVALFTEWCRQQGFGDPEILITASLAPVSGPAGQIVEVSREQQDRYFELLMNTGEVVKWIVQPAMVEVGGAVEAKQLEERLQAVSDFLKREMPFVDALLQAITTLEEERKRDKAALKFLQLEVDNLKVFNSELRASNETERILDFYHTQYEVLPLWYKRFGHVIKIIMGKRKISFTSNKEER